MVKKELTPQQRSRLCELRSIGWSYGQIKKRYQEIPLATIRSTIRSEKDRVDNVSRPRSGRPRQLSDEQVERLYQMKQADPQIKMKELIAAVDGTVQKRTIQRALRDWEASKKKQGQQPESGSTPNASQQPTPDTAPPNTTPPNATPLETALLDTAPPDT